MPKATLTKKEIKGLIVKELPRLIKSDLRIRNFIFELTSKWYAEKGKTEDRFDRIIKRLEENDLRWQKEVKKWEENERRWQENQKRWEENERRWQENQRHLERLEKEWAQRWEENQKRWEENERRWEENQRRLESLEREWNQRWEENQKVINQMLEEIRLLRERQEAESKRLDSKFDQTIGALGARWGLSTEESFRNGLRAILQDTFGVKVERYHDFDPDGIVFGRPDQVELDLIIYNNTLILAEIKSSMSKADMHAFNKKVIFYETKHNVKVQRKIVISPMVDSYAMELAKDLGIEVYSYVDKVKLNKEEVPGR